MEDVLEALPQYTDFDSPWKEILEQYFKEFMHFFFPAAYQDIDWSKRYVFLDKELQQVVRDAELGRRLVDKLIKVYTLSGNETWVAVHVEVQGSYETDFAKRMYVYNYRLFDRYNRQIVSLAILADNRKSWKPKHFRSELWGCETRFQFPSVKLLDYAGREQELEADLNPFAIVVLAYLKTRATQKHPDDRFQWKLRLFKLLYERGYSKEDILELMRFIDWIMILPKDLEIQFDEAVFQYEEEQRMKYITSFERYGFKKGHQEGQQEGRQKGRQEGRLEGRLESSRDATMDILRIRFNVIPEAVTGALNSIDDLASLKQLHRKAVTVNSLDEFLALLERHAVAA